MQFHFGKYKGQEVQDTPTAYLRWVEENCDQITPQLRKAIQDELAIRSGEETSRGRELDSPPYKSFEEMLYDTLCKWLAQECNVGRMIVPADKKEAVQVSLITHLKAEVPIKIKLFRAQRKGEK